MVLGFHTCDYIFAISAQENTYLLLLFHPDGLIKKSCFWRWPHVLITSTEAFRDV